MKQKTILEKLYAACLDKNSERRRELAQKEIGKVLKRRSKGKAVSGSKWTIVRG